MSAHKNSMSCVQVNELDAALKNYKSLGCTVRMPKSGCAVVVCPDTGYYVCEKSKFEDESFDITSA